MSSALHGTSYGSNGDGGTFQMSPQWQDSNTLDKTQANVKR